MRERLRALNDAWATRCAALDVELAGTRAERDDLRRQLAVALERRS